MRRPRHLSPEERALWEMVAKRADALDRKRDVTQRAELLADTGLPEQSPVFPKQEHLAKRVTRFQIGEVASAARPHDLVPDLGHHLSSRPVHMDSKAHGKLKRGKLSPEGRIDLHGMTLAQAHPALVGFILNAEAANKRLVLVITGKGKQRDDDGPIPTRLGVLRHQVPQWLALPPLRQAVLQIVPAHLKHGGHGAYYVYLRRRRV